MPDITHGRGASFTNAEDAAREILARTGKHVRLALPLGLGKANTIVNALTQAALEDKDIRLDIVTALTLSRPHPGSDLARRFFEPAADRLFGKYPPLLYAELMQEGSLPENISVSEFFFQAGQWLSVEAAQRNYIPANYTHALQYVLERRPNVVAQLLAVDDGGRLSLSCNTDITVDLLKARAAGEADFILAGETNSNLPFMPGPAIVEPAHVDVLLEPPDGGFGLFSAVKRPVSLQDQAIGLHASRLIRDGGTLQIGIGSIGDAIAHALLLRHERNADYRLLLDACPFAMGMRGEDNRAAFSEGLYAVTEMLVDGLLQLFEKDIIRRQVDGAAIHAGFFVEARSFYEALRTMAEERRERIHMMPVSFTNELYGDEQRKSQARRDARFINNAMKATALGAVCSDALDDGRVVSGVGGQFNFISQAFALAGARAIVTLNATRTSSGTQKSNILWASPGVTVPRHYRDVIVTEYGVADLRGRTDEEAVRAMLAITDSQYHAGLVDAAKSAGKLPRDYHVAGHLSRNTPEQLAQWLQPGRESGLLPVFPFGTDFTETEQHLLPALELLKQHGTRKAWLAGTMLAGLRVPAGNDRIAACLARMGLDKPTTWRDRLQALLLRGALGSSGVD